MDWLFDNLGKLAPVVIFVIYMLSSLKGKGQPDEGEPDPAAADRARKIQEEIRRKILERQRGEGGPTGRPPEQEPLVFDEPQPKRKPTPPRPVVSSPLREAVTQMAADQPGGRIDPFEKRRQEIEAKLEKAKEMQFAAKAKARSLTKGIMGAASKRTVTQGEIRTRLKKGLSDSDSLKTSVLLHEVLDRPIGLRRGGSSALWTNQ